MFAQEVAPAAATNVWAVWIALITTLGGLGTALIMQLASLRKGQKEVAVQVDGRMSHLLESNKQMQAKISRLEKIIVGMDKQKAATAARHKAAR